MARRSEEAMSCHVHFQGCSALGSKVYAVGASNFCAFGNDLFKG